MKASRLHKGFDAFFAARAADGIFAGTVLLQVGATTLLSRDYGVVAPHQAGFRIGCVSKQFTAAAILALVDQGRVDLDAPVHDYVDIPRASRERDGQPALVRHALTCEAGFASFRATSAYRDMLLRGPISDEAFVAHLADSPLDFKPGGGFRYSTSAYRVLSLLLESVTGLSQRRAVEKLVIVPAGLQKTHAAATAFDGATYVADPTMTCLKGAGDLISTPGDLAAWTRYLHGPRFSVAARSMMLTPQRSFYGGGLINWQNPRTQVRYHWHNGGTRDYTSILIYEPRRDLVLVALQNLDPVIADAGLSRAIFQILERTAHDGTFAA